MVRLGGWGARAGCAWWLGVVWHWVAAAYARVVFSEVHAVVHPVVYAVVHPVLYSVVYPPLEGRL
eukprot:167128-Chlamydomonas_euryale.AAC.14